MSEPQPASDHAVRKFFGVALLAIGVLMMTLCGLCTLVFFVGGLVSGGDQSFSVLALVIGGLPTGVGMLLFFGGRAMLRVPKPPPSAPPPG